jgi:hypothetical protein
MGYLLRCLNALKIKLRYDEWKSALQFQVCVCVCVYIHTHTHIYQTLYFTTLHIPLLFVSIYC